MFKFNPFKSSICEAGAINRNSVAGEAKECSLRHACHAAVRRQRVGPTEPVAILVLRWQFRFVRLLTFHFLRKGGKALLEVASHAKMQNGCLKDTGDTYRPPFDADEVRVWVAGGVACSRLLQAVTLGAAATWWRQRQMRAVESTTRPSQPLGLDALDATCHLSRPGISHSLLPFLAGQQRWWDRSLAMTSAPIAPRPTKLDSCCPSLLQWRRLGHAMVDFIADYHQSLEGLPVRSQVSPGYLAPRLPPAPPEQPEGLPAILEDVRQHILPGITHWQSPSFFAWFS